MTKSSAASKIPTVRLPGPLRLTRAQTAQVYPYTQLPFHSQHTPTASERSVSIAASPIIEQNSPELPESRTSSRISYVTGSSRSHSMSSQSQPPPEPEAIIIDISTPEAVIKAFNDNPLVPFNTAIELIDEEDKDTVIQTVKFRYPVLDAPHHVGNNPAIAARRKDALERGVTALPNKKYLLKANPATRRHHRTVFPDELQLLDEVLHEIRSTELADEEHTRIFTLNRTTYADLSSLLYRRMRESSVAFRIAGRSMPSLPAWYLGEVGGGVDEEWFTSNDFEILAITFRTEVEHYLWKLDRVYDFAHHSPRIVVDDGMDPLRQEELISRLNRKEKGRDLRASASESGRVSPGVFASAFSHQYKPPLSSYPTKNPYGISTNFYAPHASSSRVPKPMTTRLAEIWGTRDSKDRNREEDEPEPRDTAGLSPTRGQKKTITIDEYQRLFDDDGGPPSDHDDDDDDSDAGRRRGKSQPKRNERGGEFAPDNSGVRNSVNPAATFVTEPHFDLKLKVQDVPTWDGNTDIIIRWMNKVTDISQDSPKVFQQLGKVVPKRLEGAAEVWYYSLPSSYRSEIEANWDTM